MTLQLTTRPSGCSPNWFHYSATSTSTTRCPSFLVLIKTNRMLKIIVPSIAAWRCRSRQCAGHSNYSTSYTHYSLLSIVDSNWGLRSLCRMDTRCSLSSSLDSHLATSHRTLERLFLRTFPFSAAMTPQTRLRQYPAAQPGAIRGPHRAEHIRRRYMRWTGIRHIQPEHQPHRSGRAGSSQPHGTKKGRFLCGTARWSNAVPSKSSSGNGSGQRGNGAMDAKE